MSNQQILLDELDDAFGEDDPLADAFDDPKPQSPISIGKGDALSNVLAFLKERGYWVHKCHEIDHHIYPRGCYRIEYHGEIMRYADTDQLIEMEAARQRGFIEDFFGQVEGIGCAGPVRVGKPPIDAKGNPIVEVNNGNHGSLKAECEYIENTQKVFIQYMGKDENWPRGCWAVETGDPEPAYYDDEQIRYIAYDLLGMGKARKRKTQTALAKVGINALIDEATGYQDERPKDELANMLDGLLDEDDPLGLNDAFDDPEPLGSKRLTMWQSAADYGIQVDDTPAITLEAELDEAFGVQDDPIPF